MKIIVKSTPDNWKEEKEGKRQFMARKLDGRDTIEIINTTTGETFVRRITGIAVPEEEILIRFKNEFKKEA